MFYGWSRHDEDEVKREREGVRKHVGIVADVHDFKFEWKIIGKVKNNSWLTL